jgi:GT2 family glycosyltransferase
MITNLVGMRVEATQRRHDQPVANVRVGMVSWNTSELLDRSLAALPAALGGLDAEVVVVDCASSDDSVAVARGHGVEVHASPTNLGFSAAMTLALSGTEAEFLVALNPNTVAPPGSIEALVAHLRLHPDVGLASPRLVAPDGRPQFTAHRFPTVRQAAALAFLPARVNRGGLGRRLLLPTAPAPDEPADVDWTYGAVQVVRRAALGGRAPYDDRWFLFVSDLDICWRLRGDGWRVRYVPSITMTRSASAAASRAYGDRLVHEHLEATADWYELRRGRPAAALWNVVNAVGCVRWAVAAPGERRAALRRARTHLRLALRGAPDPTLDRDGR